MSNERLADKVLLDDQKSKSLASDTSTGMNKVKKPRQESAISVETMRGKVRNKIIGGGFGASVLRVGATRKLASALSTFSR